VTRTRAAVVVPTRDRPHRLSACLDALAGQVLPPAEVVVVDDGSVDAAAVACAVAAVPGCRLVQGGGRGPAAARNLGARATSCEVIAFTDDDCVPRPGWLAALVARAERGADAVAGPTVVGPGASAASAAAQVVTNHLVTEARDRVRATLAFAPTSNLLVRAGVHEVHPFDERFPSAAGEDRAWCERVGAAGLSIAEEPAAVVEHRPELTLLAFWRQQVRYGRGARRFRRGSAGAPGLPSVGFYLRLLRTGFAAGPAVGALVGVAQVATAAGIATEALSEARGAARRR
jgi:GT2 family glycosyltransferase